jgi:hypothetical protein
MLAWLLLPAAAAAQSCQPLQITSTAAIHETAPFFASWNVDSSRDRLFFDLNFSDPRFVYLASQIGAPGRIRFGGTGNDALAYALGAAAGCVSGARAAEQPRRLARLRP